MTRTPEEFEARLAQYIEALQAHVNQYYATAHDGRLQADKIEISRGPKFIRVISARQHRDGGRSVHSFLDYQGNIYKSESWKKPAKHIRGSIWADNCDVGRAVNHFGANYLR